jgi:hypothetical protein
MFLDPELTAAAGVNPHFLSLSIRHPDCRRITRRIGREAGAALRTDQIMAGSQWSR